MAKPRNIRVMRSSERPAYVNKYSDARLMEIRREYLEENRGATPDEQRVLAKYSGFGDSAFGQAFNAYTQDNAWERRRDELKDLVTKEEFDGIAESRTNAFYGFVA